MVATKDVKKPYWAVKKPTPVSPDLLNRLLGLAVVDFADPLGKNYRPDRPLKPRDAIDDLYPERHAEMKDYEKVLKRVDKASARAAFQTVVEACLSAMKEEGSTLKAPHLRRIDMDNAVKRIHDLLRSPGTPSLPDDEDQLVEPAALGTQPAAGPGLEQAVKDEMVVKEGASDATGAVQSWQSWIFLWLFWATAFFGIGPDAAARRKAEQEQNRLEYRRQVLQLLRENERVGIINSIITACDLTMLSGATTKGRAAAGGGTGPGAGPINVHVRGEVEHIRDVGEQGTYVGEYLIACSYLPLKLNTTSSVESGRKRTFPFFSRAPAAQQDAEWSLGMREVWKLGQNEIPGDTARLLHAETPMTETSPEDEDADSASEETDFWIMGTEEVSQDEGDSPM
ncbi:hypothetical protein DL546_006393 [Coniochaeta pulveracea]|uniref:Uncharacterized protein n=1 Tax=Coniochaeta pulveracea TaxID=177199 RepID=A0A420YBM8_9PEZI|nr:hypothetical protein DL546_006393 [Coniochaeta pulveracea]